MSVKQGGVKHMSGPWHWHSSRTMQHLQNAEGSCFSGVSMPAVSNKNYHVDKETYDANASLIASAPELLEACKDILSTIEMRGIKGFKPTTLIALEQAIAKAERRVS